MNGVPRGQTPGTLQRLVENETAWSGQTAPFRVSRKLPRCPAPEEANFPGRRFRAQARLARLELGNLTLARREHELVAHVVDEDDGTPPHLPSSTSSESGSDETLNRATQRPGAKGGVRALFGDVLLWLLP